MNTTCPPHHLLALGTAYAGEGRERCMTVTWRCCKCGYERQEPVEPWMVAQVNRGQKRAKKKAKEATNGL